MVACCLVWSLLAAVAADAPKSQTFEFPEGPVADAVAILDKTSSSATAADLRAAARAAADLLAPASPAAEALHSVAGSKGEATELKARLSEIHQDLTFQPLREAELPEGFPAYTPPGSIELKTYPVHRRAVAKQFFTLFSHITRKNIAMTAPVRMEFERSDEGKLEQGSMAFFYSTPETGEVGVDDADEQVETIEDEGQVVVALGRRGRWNREVLADGERRLRDWIKANPGYRECGGLIVMGYNSPMVPTAQQFFEIQLPVEKAEKE
jgi:hypothetical protein